MTSYESLFQPTKLKALLAEISKQHTKEYSGQQIISESDTTLKELIYRIVGLKKSELSKEAILLETKEQIMITKYIPHNFYSVEMDNIYLLFEYFITDKLAEILFHEWLDTYEDESCNKFMAKLCDKNDLFKKVCTKLGMESNVLKRLLISEDIPSETCKYLKENGNNDDTLEKKLEDIGIKEDSGLYDACEYCFYLYCRKADYENLNIQELKAILTRYTKNKAHIKAFIENFLICFTLAELRKYDDLLPVILQVTGERNTAKYTAFFATVDNRIYRKFDDWVMKAYIIIWLGKERGHFWTQYTFNNIETKYIDKFGMVILEAEDYVVIEFLEMGYAYFYVKQEFWDYVAPKIKWSFNVTELKQFLNYDTDYEDRKKHLPSPGWEGHFAYYIEINSITTIQENY